MNDQNDSKDNEEVQKQINALMYDIKEHAAAMTKVLESLQQASRGTVSILHFKALKEALATFTTARKSVETAKRLVKNWAQEELKE